MISITNFLGENESIPEETRDIVDRSSIQYEFHIDSYCYAIIYILLRRSDEMARNDHEPRQYIVAVSNGRDAISYCTISFHKELGGADGALVKVGMLHETHLKHHLEKNPPRNREPKKKKHWTNG